MARKVLLDRIGEIFIWQTGLLVLNHWTESNYNSQQRSRFERTRFVSIFETYPLSTRSFFRIPNFPRKVVTRRNVSKIFSVARYFRWYGLYGKCIRHFYTAVDIRTVSQSWHKSSEVGLISAYFRPWFLLKLFEKLNRIIEIKDAEGNLRKIRRSLF